MWINEIYRRTYESLLEQVRSFVPPAGREAFDSLMECFNATTQAARDEGFGAGWRGGYSAGVDLEKARCAALVELAREQGRIEGAAEAAHEAGVQISRIAAEYESGEASDGAALSQLDVDIAAGKIRPS